MGKYGHPPNPPFCTLHVTHICMHTEQQPRSANQILRDVVAMVTWLRYCSRVHLEACWCQSLCGITYCKRDFLIAVLSGAVRTVVPITQNLLTIFIKT